MLAHHSSITSAGLLPARYVIHTVGPIWEGDQDEPELLASALRNSMRLAEEHDLSSIAFPAISTGTYGYPIEQAARIALETTVAYLRSGGTLRRILFILFTEDDLEAYRHALADVLVVSRQARDQGQSGLSR
ncbi:MAG TPA: macro domain-containing protein [Chloroflexota bacterium]|nr:macro domain-containing protein [Chloroflexota bacterium]